MAIGRLKLEAVELVSGGGNTGKLETPDLWNPGVTSQSSECFQWEFLTKFGCTFGQSLDEIDVYPHKNLETAG